MKERFKHYWFSDCGAQPNQKVLVALSGGADSVVLLRLLHEIGVQCTAAHCNFQLRGTESQRDSDFVTELCSQLDIPLHIIRFETATYAQENGISIEMAARDLRYAWFERLMIEQNLDLLALGHHSDDQAETFFLNVVRGTGIHGLVGMGFRKGNRVRPLLAFSRTMLEDYVLERKWDFVSDSSNLSDAHLRNRIRHQIVPVCKQINPSFLLVMEGNMRRMAQLERWLAGQVGSFRAEAVASMDGQMLISVDKLRQLSEMELFVFELLVPFGINGDQAQMIARLVREQASGRQFFSKTHRVVVDRYNIVVLPISNANEIAGCHFVDPETVQINEPVKISFRNMERTVGFAWSKNPLHVHLDAALLEYPLVIRRWQKGDVFKPLGMKGFQKLSDFFTNEKLSLVQKENVWLLCSGDEVVWVVGYRIDDRFKVTDKTSVLLEMKVEK